MSMKVFANIFSLKLDCHWIEILENKIYSLSAMIEKSQKFSNVIKFCNTGGENISGKC